RSAAHGTAQARVRLVPAMLPAGRAEGCAHMAEGRRDGHDSRPEEIAPGGQPPGGGGQPPAAPEGDAQTWYRRGLDLLGNGSPAAAAQLLERAAGAEPQSRMVREALARAQ